MLIVYICIYIYIYTHIYILYTCTKLYKYLSRARTTTSNKRGLPVQKKTITSTCKNMSTCQ